jgi:hypothetical protein
MQLDFPPLHTVSPTLTQHRAQGGCHKCLLSAEEKTGTENKERKKTSKGPWDRACAPLGPVHNRSTQLPHLVLLVLLQQLTAVAQKLLQAQLRLPALAYALGEVCHQAVGTREQPLGCPSATQTRVQFCCPPPLLPWEPGLVAALHWASVCPSAKWTPG